MNWIILLTAGLFEVGLTFCLGKTHGSTGLTYYMWGTGFFVSTFLSMYLLAIAVKTIPLGTAYPVWTGIGAVGTVIIGIIFFHEPATFWRIFFISTLVLSIIGLKLISH
jgi:quaternary ammonium compound-resistance protein SugE